MKKSTLLTILNWLVQPAPYPHVAAYHAIVGAAGWWWLRHGAPSSYSFTQVLLGAGIGLVVGFALTLVLGKQEAE